MEIETVVVGSRWRGPNAVAAIARMKPGDTVRLEREPNNRADYAAIGCHYHGLLVGYIPRQVNGSIAKAMDAGAVATATVRVAARVSDNGFIVAEPKICLQVGTEPQL